MRSIRGKRILLMMLAIMAMTPSCRKVTLSSSGKPSNDFNQDGRDFIFPSTVYSEGKVVTVSIPADAVNGNSYLEYYQYRLEDGNSVDSFYVNGTAADINLFISDGQTLAKPATIRIPFYFAAVFDPSSGYAPYRVHAADYSNLVPVLDQTNNWERITDFTYDNSTQHLIFQTYHLDGIYVVAKKK